MHKFIDLTGKTFGKWTVLKKTERRGGKWYWLCRCLCGIEKEVSGKHLNSGESTQCRGCAHRTHGATNGKAPRAEYVIWRSMIARCNSPKNPAYPRYGGRGIRVCLRWQESFESFLADMGPRPVGMSLDRRNNDRGYEPDNCRWATPTQQNRNRRDNKMLTAFGETHCMAEWADILGVNRSLIKDRLRRGWPVEKALIINGPSYTAGEAAHGA